MKLLPLLAVVVVVIGFALRLNPLLVVVVAALLSGLLAKLGIVQLLALIGDSFVKNRFLFVFVLTLPLLGLLEREGLKERARDLIRNLRLRPNLVTPGRLLIAYQLLRQITAAIGLTSLGGHPQTVRPLIAPMCAAAAERVAPKLSDALRQRIFALAAATDNVALFFGEDLFMAFGAVLLVQGVFREHGIILEPLRIAIWGLPTAILALLIHGARLLRFDRRLEEDR
jgi:uncharacterized membrane protein